MGNGKSCNSPIAATIYGLYNKQQILLQLKLVLNVEVNFATYDAAFSALKLMAKHFRAYSTLT